MARNEGRTVAVPADDSGARRFLGFDCSSKTIGWGLVCDRGGSKFLAAHGHIRPLPSSHDLMDRLDDVFRRVTDLCQQLRPDVVAVEEIALFMKGGQSTAQTITTLASFNRVTALAAFRSSRQLSFYPVQTIRKLVRQAAGRRGAISKTDMPDIIRAHLCPDFSDVEKRGGGRAEQTYDEADGIAVAWACAHELGS